MIYDALGQEIKEIIAGDQEAGYQSITWNAANGSGNPVASGMYFYRIEAQPTGESAAAMFTEVRKMLLIR